jgi:hypothetical protein
MLVVVNHRNSDLGLSIGIQCPTASGRTTTAGSALDGVASLQLCGELGGIGRIRAIHILLRGVGVTDGARARDVANLVLDVLEG